MGGQERERQRGRINKLPKKIRSCNFTSCQLHWVTRCKKLEKQKPLQSEQHTKGYIITYSDPLQSFKHRTPSPAPHPQLPETLDPQQKWFGFPYREMKGEMILVTKKQQHSKWKETDGYLVLNAQSTMTVIHRFPDPWHWNKQLSWSGIMRDTHPREIARRENMKQLSATRPCLDTWHVKKLWQLSANTPMPRHMACEKVVTTQCNTPIASTHGTRKSCDKLIATPPMPRHMAREKVVNIKVSELVLWAQSATKNISGLKNRFRRKGGDVVLRR